TWSHYVEILRFNDNNKINYYIHMCETFNLSVRKLRERIKSNEYERIGYKEELEEPKINDILSALK
ncbi:MAG: cytoplasmic protein, partial [Bacilli bacterium]|nr:cytoplasmic protein [Bacilli bacterium]